MSWRALLALADRFERRTARAYVEAVHRVRTSLARQRLEHVLASGGNIDIAALDRQFGGTVDVVVESFQASGRATAADLVERLRVDIGARFDITDPLTADLARTQGSRLIVHITSSVRQAVQEIIATATQQGIPVRDTATLVETFIGLDPRRARAALRHRQALVDAGLNAATVQKRSAQYAARLLRDRALTIARTEVMFATNAGQRESWRQANAAGLLPPRTRRRWMVTPDDRLCPLCQRMDGATTTLDRPFPARAGRLVLSPPLHPKCRCTEVLEFARR